MRQDVARGDPEYGLIVQQHVKKIVLGKAFHRFAANVFQHLLVRLFDPGNGRQHLVQVVAGPAPDLLDQIERLSTSQIIALEKLIQRPSE